MPEPERYELCDAPGNPLGPQRCSIVKGHGGTYHVAKNGACWPIDPDQVRCGRCGAWCAPNDLTHLAHEVIAYQEGAEIQVGIARMEESIMHTDPKLVRFIIKPQKLNLCNRCEYQSFPTDRPDD